MTEALLHHTDISSPPVGIWWVDDVGELRSHYVDSGEAEAVVGRQAMLGKLPDAPWAQYFQHLSGSNPIVMGWEPIEVADDPAQVVELLYRTGQRTE